MEACVDNSQWIRHVTTDALDIGSACYTIGFVLWQSKKQHENYRNLETAVSRPARCDSIDLPEAMVGSHQEGCQFPCTKRDPLNRVANLRCTFILKIAKKIIVESKSDIICNMRGLDLGEEE